MFICIYYIILYFIVLCCVVLCLFVFIILYICIYYIVYLYIIFIFVYLYCIIHLLYYYLFLKILIDYVMENSKTNWSELFLTDLLSKLERWNVTESIYKITVKRKKPNLLLIFVFFKQLEIRWVVRFPFFLIKYFRLKSGKGSRNMEKWKIIC